MGTPFKIPTGSQLKALTRLKNKRRKFRRIEARNVAGNLCAGSLSRNGRSSAARCARDGNCGTTHIRRHKKDKQPLWNETNLMGQRRLNQRKKRSDHELEED